ncbi:hypothetical protein GCM10009804_45020 [Kribbella hippodromi]|uniref:TROVE domain-containing protein n=1 Tax=Kribbella hippodromi TaxID=434347 RepID=A0ABN2DTQ4_9ACTN
MSTDPLAQLSTRRTPQDRPAEPRQRINSAGGYTFVQDDLARLHRFLTIGTTGGTAYASEHALTQENAGLIVGLARKRTTEVVTAVLDISLSGRAPKQRPALFALAAAAKLGDDDGRRAALAAVPLVARTGTHLFQFTGYLEQFGGWGRGTRRAIGNWYVDPDRSVDAVVYQILKYRRRNGWSHADLLRLSHPTTTEPVRRELFDWLHGRPADLSGLPLVAAFERLQRATDVAETAGVIAEHRALSWEMIPDRFLNEPRIWEVLLANGLPQTALLRQLPRLTRLGLLDPSGPWVQVVADQLTDVGRLRKARVHPISVLVAQRIYSSGQGGRGRHTAGAVSASAGVGASAGVRASAGVGTSVGVGMSVGVGTSAGVGASAGVRSLWRAARSSWQRALSSADRVGAAAAQLRSPGQALRTFADGARAFGDRDGARGGRDWAPSQPIVDALDAAFYLSYDAVEPTGKRTLLALDVSGSMTSPVSGLPISCREASAALALVTAATEPACEIVGFTSKRNFWDTKLTPLAISPRLRLESAIRAVSDLPFGGTDCALPMQYALRRKLAIDTFVVYTDNETWHGKVHPHQALQEYRREMGIDARLVVVSMTANGRTIANPSDPGMLDVSGFDSAVPALINTFTRER